MASLYELTNEFLELDRLYMESVDEETGEIINAHKLEEVEVRLGKLLEEKSEGIIKYTKNLESDIASLKLEEKRLTELRKRKEKKLDGFKKYIEFNLVRIGKNKIDTNIGSISIRKSVQTVINEDVIEYNPQYATKSEVIKYDKATIKKLIEQGEEIDGATLVENLNVNIK